MIEFVKQDKILYAPPQKPVVVEVPTLNMLQVDGSGPPEGESYQNAVGVLYSIAYTIKMSKMGDWQPAGYEDFAVPPLEGLWNCDGVKGFDPDRNKWSWTSLLRMPDFVTGEVLGWAIATGSAKKPELDFGGVRLAPFAEGLCVQMMHVGPYTTEQQTIDQISSFILENGYQDAIDGSAERRHHEIYLSDPRRAKPENMKTILRHPVKHL